MHPVILKQKSSSKSGFLVGKGWQTIRIFFLYQTARNSITLDVNVDDFVTLEYFGDKIRS